MYLVICTWSCEPTVSTPARGLVVHPSHWPDRRSCLIDLWVPKATGVRGTTFWIFLFVFVLCGLSWCRCCGCDCRCLSLRCVSVCLSAAVVSAAASASVSAGLVSAAAVSCAAGLGLCLYCGGTSVSSGGIIARPPDAHVESEHGLQGLIWAGSCDLLDHAQAVIDISWIVWPASLIYLVSACDGLGFSTQGLGFRFFLSFSLTVSLCYTVLFLPLLSLSAHCWLIS